MKKYDVVAIIGTYTDRNGNEKPRYMNIGFVNESEKGLSIKLDAVPTAWNGWANFYEPKARENKSHAEVSSEKPESQTHDDIPW